MRSQVKLILILILSFSALSGNKLVAQFVVNSTIDTPDANVGDGICADAGGNCTLRAAVMEANASAGDNSISLPIGEYVISIPGQNENLAATGDLDISDNLIITGADTRQTIVRADSLDRVFDIFLGVTVTLEFFEIWEGEVAAANGGAIQNTGTLTLNEVAIKNSMCAGDNGGGQGGGRGGAIYNIGDLSLNQVTINNCLALGGRGANGTAPGGGSGGGGAPGMGGAIYNDILGSCSIQNCTFSSNTAQGGRGGNGTFHQGSGVTQSAGGAGGGSGGTGGGNSSAGAPGNWGGGGGGGGSISGAGGAGGFGGGGGGGGASSWGGNAGPGGPGGQYGGAGGQGCCSGGSGGGGGAGLGGAIFDFTNNIEIFNCTFAFNQAVGGNGGGGWFSGGGAAGQGKGGAVFNPNGSVAINNCLFAANTASTDGPALSGNFDSVAGHNLIQNTDDTMVLGGNVMNNQLNVDPFILPLANNGGNTDTHLLEACNPLSPAIDAGNDAFASALDQIGQARVNVSEIGAIEVLASSINLLPADTVLCAGETLLLDVTSDNSTYLWSDNSTNPTILVSEAGTYSVNITQNGCDYFDEINVSYALLDELDLGENLTLCPQETQLLQANILGANYLWQDNSTGNSFLVSEAGTYSVEVSLGECVGSDDIVIEYVEDPNLDLGPDLELCEGESVNLSTALVADAYLWSTNENATSIEVSETALYTLEIEIDNCSFSDEVNVIFAPNPQFDFGADLELCEGESVELDPNYPNGNFEWQDGSTSNTFLVEETGTYSLTIVEGNCEASDEVNVNFSPLPVFDLGEDVSICEGESVELSTDLIADAYLWSTNETSNSIEVNSTGIFVLEVQLNSCVFSDEVLVEITPTPVFDLGPDLELCAGESAVLDPNYGPGVYEWQDGSANMSFTVNQAGSYSLSISEGTCVGSDEVEVNYTPIPVFDLGEDLLVCYSDEVNLEVNTGLDGVNVTWNTGQSGASISPATSGNYQATANLNNCIYSDGLELEIIPPMNFDLGGDRVLCQGQELELSANPQNFNYPVDFEWSNGDFGPSSIVSSSGNVEVVVSSDCEVLSDRVLVLFEQCGCEIYVPNAFTPDQDGVNEFFVVETQCVFEDYLLNIFNRDGEVVFSAVDPAELWNGSFQGGEHFAPNGSYIYRLEYSTETLNGIESGVLSGHITLIR